MLIYYSFKFLIHILFSFYQYQFLVLIFCWLFAGIAYTQAHFYCWVHCSTFSGVCFPALIFYFDNFLYLVQGDQSNLAFIVHRVFFLSWLSYFFVRVGHILISIKIILFWVGFRGSIWQLIWSLLFSLGVVWYLCWGF